MDDMLGKPIFMATHPRACSTAFERVFMTRRKSLQTIHEPFGDAFYFGPERMSSRYEEDEAVRHKSGFAESTFRTILERIEREGQAGKRVFIKDIMYYMFPPERQQPQIAPSLHTIKRGVGTDEASASSGERLDGSQTPDSGIALYDGGDDKEHVSERPRSPPFPFDTPAEPVNPTVVPAELLEKFHFTFLIRHPRASIPSFYRCCVPPLVETTGFHEFMPSEAGYDELRRFFDYTRDAGMVGPHICGRDGHERGGIGVEICVIDADDLLDDPEGILSQYCASVGLDLTQAMLNWNEEDQEHAKQAFEKWNGWHEDAIHSTDLKARAHKRQPKSDEQLFDEWTAKFGEDAAKVIRKTVDNNVADYNYLKQFAIKPLRV